MELPKWIENGEPVIYDPSTIGAVQLRSGASHHSGRAMSYAEQLLLQILESGDIVGQDGIGRTLLQLAVDRATLERLMAFGADAAEHEENGDDEAYEAPPVHACWFGAA